jgi:hypothetical protein
VRQLRRDEGSAQFGNRYAQQVIALATDAGTSRPIARAAVRLNRADGLQMGWSSTQNSLHSGSAITIQPPGLERRRVVDDGRAEVEEAGDLFFLARVVRQQVQMHSALDRLSLGHGDEEQPRQAPIGRLTTPVVVAR